MIQENLTEVVPFPEKSIGSPRIAPAEVIVVENSRPVGILTKIDVLDYVAGKI